MILLHRVDPARNMARFYVVAITSDLFGDFALERTWGRIGKRGQLMREWFESRQEAAAARKRLVRSKQRRGYRIFREALR